MVIRWYKRIGHSWFSNFILVSLGCLIFKNLMFQEKSTYLHAIECPCASKHYLYLFYILYWIHPCEVAINIMDDHMVSVSPTGVVWGFTCLICVHGFSCYMPISICRVFSRVDCWFVFTWCLVGFYWFGGAKSLSFYYHAPLLCFFIFRYNFNDILGADEWPCEIISLFGGFDSRGFFQKTCFWMEVSNGCFNAWELIHVVYGFWWFGLFGKWVFLHGLLPLECLGHKIWNFFIIIHMDCLVEGCQYCGWWCLPLMGWAIDWYWSPSTCFNCSLWYVYLGGLSIIYVFLFSIVYGYVVSIRKLASTK